MKPARRNEQIRIKVTPAEKKALVREAQRLGIGGVAPWLRSLGLAALEQRHDPANS